MGYRILENSFPKLNLGFPMSNRKEARLDEMAMRGTAAQAGEEPGPHLLCPQGAGRPPGAASGAQGLRFFS